MPKTCSKTQEELKILSNELTKEDMTKAFVETNLHQEKPCAVHILAMKIMAGTLCSTEEMPHNITDSLN